MEDEFQVKNLEPQEPGDLCHTQKINTLFIEIIYNDDTERRIISCFKCGYEQKL